MYCLNSLIGLLVQFIFCIKAKITLNINQIMAFYCHWNKNPSPLCSLLLVYLSISPIHSFHCVYCYSHTSLPPNMAGSFLAHAFCLYCSFFGWFLPISQVSAEMSQRKAFDHGKGNFSPISFHHVILFYFLWEFISVCWVFLFCLN